MHGLDAAAVRTCFAALETTEHRKFKLYWFLHSICAIAVADGLLSRNPCRLGGDKAGRVGGSGIISWMAGTVVWV
ncbi:hypothetical protein [Mycolicibacterium sp. CR10]|uniref:hypothetical protein n=1 Tax=Mycolicibacterium sp. CR10 TaxID=2562314 RepID=UPI0010C0E2C7|nr:hypothetical protein [Mycolicibacterium sp. CR10]